MRNLKKIASAVAVAGLALASSMAHATLTLTIDDLSTAGVDFTTSDPAALEALVYGGGKFGSWTVGSWGFGNGSSQVFGIDLVSGSMSSLSGGTLRITLTETDLSLGAAGNAISVNSLIGGTTQGTISYAAWIDDSNAAFGHGAQLFNGTTVGLTGGTAFSASGYSMPTASDPFSLTLQVDITHTGKYTSSFDFSASVPEPGTLALLSVALLGAGFASRRRNKA